MNPANKRYIVSTRSGRAPARIDAADATQARIQYAGVHDLNLRDVYAREVS